MGDSLLSIATTSLNASQYALSVTSNNIANADTVGYVRRTVTFGEITSDSWLSGLGVDVASVQRSFDAFLEGNYLDKRSDVALWDTAESYLESLENLLDQSDGTGINDILAEYFAAWEDLAASPDDESARTALLGIAEELAAELVDLDASLNELAQRMDQEITDQVEEVNSILEQLATLNPRIAANQDNLELLDTRDQLLRELSDYLEISVTYASDGTVMVVSESGQALVSQNVAYSLSYDPAKAWASLNADSTFEGQINFAGSSSSEIVLEVVTAGTVDGSAGAAQLKISLDGGQTWLTDDDGNTLLFTADGEDGAITVDGVTIWLSAEGDAGADGAGSLAVGDSFTVMAKKGLYWHSTTSGAENITPLADADSGLVSDRVSSGSLAGLFYVRDECLASYQEDLDALVATLVYETNYAYSQGASPDNLTAASGTYAVDDTAGALGSNAGLAFSDQLAAGNLSLAVYDTATGDLLNLSALDFDSATAGIQSFDPTAHSLEDVADAINTTFSGQITASIENGTLILTAADGMEFAFAGDSTGLLAALGLNTFFTGSTAGDLGLNPGLLADPSQINAGALDASGELTSGSNSAAQAVAALADTELSITRADGRTTTSTLQDYFNTLVSQVGADSAGAQTLATYSQTLADDLADQQEQLSGVNLDEELVLLEKYQRAYEAASKIITISNEMFDTVIGLI